MARQKSEKSAVRAGATAPEIAQAVTEALTPRIRAAAEAIAPALETARQQIPAVAGSVAGRLAQNMQPIAGAAIDRAGSAFGEARQRSGELAEQVVQAAYQVSQSLPPDARRAVESSLRKTGVSPAVKRRGPRKRWLAAGLLAAAGTAFLFSGTIQDKVYDLVERLQGQGADDDEAWSAGAIELDRPEPAGDAGEAPAEATQPSA